MNLISLYAHLRHDLKNLILNAKESGDDIKQAFLRTNFHIQCEINHVAERYTILAESHGVYLLQRGLHCDKCNIDPYAHFDRHGKLQENNEYELLSSFSARKDIPCPFSKNGVDYHYCITNDSVFVIDIKKRIPESRNLANILFDLYSAADIAQERVSRSAIRESLLQTLLSLNDLILPIPVDEYVDMMLRKLGEPAICYSP